MLRRLFTLLSAVSLLLCATTVVLWVRSYWVCDSVGWLQRHDRLELVHAGLLSEAGALGIDTAALKLPVDFQLPADWEAENTGWRSEPAEPGPRWRENLLPRSRVVSGFAGHGAIPGEWRSIGIPYWLFAVILVGLPLCYAAGLARAKRRRRQNCCPRCGYDLRATPGRCPECGAVQPTT